MLTQAEQDKAVESLRAFAERYAELRVESTGASVVTHTGVLYNVKGSTNDPKIDGLTWKALLQYYGINGPCYADTPLAPPSSSHPDFSVGGHVTPNQDGSVAIGGICYLMPLCYWHNGKANDEQPFHHTLITMLRLTGYMTAEPAATFLARMGGRAPLALVFLDESGLAFRELADDRDALDAALGEAVADRGRTALVLLRRHGTGATATYSIERAQFAGG